MLQFNGVSGADGQACSHVAPAEDEGRPIWNDTFFREVGGGHAWGRTSLEILSLCTNGDPACAAAFAAFRVMPHFTGGEVFHVQLLWSVLDHAYLAVLAGFAPPVSS